MFGKVDRFYVAPMPIESKHAEHKSLIKYDSEGENMDSKIKLLINGLALLGIVGLLSTCGGSSGGGQSERIFFHSDRDGGNVEVYVVNLDGTGLARLTNNPAVDFHPSRSPDGSRILFLSNRDGDAEVYVMNADGSGQTNLTNNPGRDDRGSAR